MLVNVGGDMGVVPDGIVEPVGRVEVVFVVEVGVSPLGVFDVDVPVPVDEVGVVVVVKVGVVRVVEVVRLVWVVGVVGVVRVVVVIEGPGPLVVVTPPSVTLEICFPDDTSTRWFRNLPPAIAVLSRSASPFM